MLWILGIKITLHSKCKVSFLFLQIYFYLYIGVGYLHSVKIEAEKG